MCQLHYAIAIAHITQAESNKVNKNAFKTFTDTLNYDGV